MSKTRAEEAIPGAFDALFAAWNRSDAPGLVVGVSRQGHVLYRRAFGMASLESGVALTPATRMRIGSTSKHFTALLALLLAEDGLIDLDVPVRTYLPELAGPGGDASIRLLLQHRGGVRCFLDLGFIAHDMAAIPVGEALRVQARQLGRNFPPGQAMLYSNGGYHIVSHALSRAAGLSFEALLQRRLFHPLGMNATLSVPGDHAIVPGMATLHVPDGHAGWRRGLFPGEDIRGEGGIVSTLDDMLVWADHLYRRDRFGRPESWRALLEAPIYDDGTAGSYALGMELSIYRGLNIEHHAGGVIGGSCQLLRVPDHGISVIIIANGADGANPVELAERCVDILLQDQLKDPPPPVDAAPYASLIGDYVSIATGMLYGLVAQDGKLKATFNGSPYPIPLVDLGDGRVAMRMAGISDIEFDLAGATGSEIPIRFGIRTDLYHRLAGRQAFDDTDCCGRYWSIDGDCSVTIERTDQGLCARFSDHYGSSTVFLHLRRQDFAIATRSPDGEGAIASLVFESREGRSASFRLATLRTRQLRFERCVDAR